MDKDQDRVVALEAEIDRSSLLDVLTALELACTEKAEHLRSNWQDNATAKVWDKAAKIIYQAATKVSPLGI